MTYNSGLFFKGRYLSHPTRKGEYLSDIQAKNKSDALNGSGYVSFVKPEKFGKRTKFVVIASKRGSL